ncbi:hypothetical protein R3P38DRAFT_3090981 [Favolaschia claudopus]|uniref:MYND-type domain-containing protein n=1 Tax=Favolaschia claudopus TaxID=2862362 RepID=A0AAV9ZSA7_9AGAR
MDTCGNTLCDQIADRQCSECKKARYCSRECQKQNWPTHKIVCKSLKEVDKTRCTGCKKKFGSEIGRPDETCPDCHYTACASCACHNRRGTCYCENFNFGHPYCGRVPEWYHASQATGKVYRGDNHPEASDASSHGIPDAQWEAEPRKCGNCGEVKRCLIPGYMCNNWLCQ